MMKLSFISDPELENQAELFIKNNGILSAPVDVELLAEKIGFYINSIRADDRTFVGALFPKIKTIGVSEKILDNENRYRFTIAHELGHYVLHKHIYDSFSGENYDDWCRFYFELKEAGVLDRSEIQANFFAGALLMPKSLLENDLEQLKQYYAKLDEDLRKDTIVNKLAQKYCVSQQTANIRLRKLSIL